MENLVKMDDLGGNTPIFGNIHINSSILGMFFFGGKTCPSFWPPFHQPTKNLGGRGRLKTSKTGTWTSVLLGKFIPFLSELEVLEAQKTPRSVKLREPMEGDTRKLHHVCLNERKGCVCDAFVILNIYIYINVYHQIHLIYLIHISWHFCLGGWSWFGFLWCIT